MGASPGIIHNLAVKTFIGSVITLEKFALKIQCQKHTKNARIFAYKSATHTGRYVANSWLLKFLAVCLFLPVNLLSCQPLLFRYSYTLNTDPIDAKALCSKGIKGLFNGDKLDNSWAKELGGDFGLPMYIIKNFQNIMDKVNISKEKVCERYINSGMAIVKFQMPDSNVLILKNQLRTTIGEQFSIVGKGR